MARIMMIVLTLFLAGRTQAQSAQVFYSGSLDFHYAQFPFGPFSGDFSVEGEIDTTQWIPTMDEGVGGEIASMDSTGAEQMLAIAAKRNVAEDTTYHVFGIFYRASGTIVEGPVPDALTSVQLFLLWNLDSLVLPTELPDSLNLEDILGALSAEHKCLGAATSLDIVHRDATTLDFTFAGMAIDLENTMFILSFTNGSSHMVGFDISPVETAWRPGHHAPISTHPNPFNPETRLDLALDRPGQTELRVHDLRGRLVEQQSLGYLQAGRQHLQWRPAGLPSGHYLLSVWQDGKPQAQGQALHLK